MAQDNQPIEPKKYDLIINMEQAKFLLEAIAQKPVATNIEAIARGVTIDPAIIMVIDALQMIVNPPPPKVDAPKFKDHLPSRKKNAQSPPTRTDKSNNPA